MYGVHQNYLFIFISYIRKYRYSVKTVPERFLRFSRCQSKTLFILNHRNYFAGVYDRIIEN